MLPQLVAILLAITPTSALHPHASPSVKDQTNDKDAPPRTVQQSEASPQFATSQRDLIATFTKFVGIKEQPMGSNNGPMVDKFNASCGLSRSDHAPWCASVTHYGYIHNGLTGHGAYSPNWFYKKRVVQQQDVQPADVGLIYFPSMGRYAHTIACVQEATRSAGRVVQVRTLEGNTNAQGSREGDQFAKRLRPADTITFVRWWK